MLRVSVVCFLAILLIGPIAFCSGANALMIPWGKLKHTVGTRPVVIEVERATRVYGTITGQDDSGVVIAVKDSKPGNAYTRNSASRVERSAITRVAVVKDPLRTGWRWAGAVAGYFAGVGLAVATGAGEQDPRIMIGMVAGPILGYYAGKSLDKQLVEIHFLDSGPMTPATKPRAAILPGYLTHETHSARGREIRAWQLLPDPSR